MNIFLGKEKETTYLESLNSLFFPHKTTRWKKLPICQTIRKSTTKDGNQKKGNQKSDKTGKENNNHR